MKVLFLPNYLGGGFGHIGRCLALSGSFSARGDSVSFMMNGPHTQTVVKAGVKVHVIDVPQMPVSTVSRPPAYIYVSDMSYQVVRDGFISPQIVSKSIAECLKAIAMEKPDVLVGDGHCLTGILGKKAGIPVVQFVKSIVRPHAQEMVWWEDKPVAFRPPDPKPVFNPVLRRAGLKEVVRAEDLLFGDLLVLPSIPSLDPVEILPENTHYVGPVIREKAAGKDDLPEWFQQLEKDRPVVYITVGGAAGNGGSKEFYRILQDAFSDSSLQVVVSTGGKASSGPEYSGENIRFVSWVPGVKMISVSQLVVFHGGYTRMEILMQGIPSVVIPFHSEQEYYGRLLEKLGVAKLAVYSDEPYQCHIQRWKGGGQWIGTRPYSVHYRRKPTLTGKALREVVDIALKSSEMKSNAMHLQGELAKYPGSAKIACLVHDLFHR